MINQLKGQMNRIRTKYWGHEFFITHPDEVDNKYCYKRIYINAGHRTSLQYHEQKVETNYLIEGEATLLLENDEGIIEECPMVAGDHITIQPMRKHRVIAKTDIILQEVSSPEINDCIRIEDDANRGDGKINYEDSPNALCILAAGLGSRMGNLTDHTNKCLLPIGEKAIISHIIALSPKDYDIVVVIGYQGHLVQQYCELAHPDRNFIFVEDTYGGPENGPGTALIKCQEHLQRPFVIAVGDCMLDKIPSLVDNWIGVYPTSMPELFSTVANNGGVVTDIKNKSAEGYEDAFIGVAGIRDFEQFFTNLNATLEKNQDGELVEGLADFTKQCTTKAEHLDWTDVGTLDSYLRNRGETLGLPKLHECAYRMDTKLIKIFADNTKAKNLTIRAKDGKDVFPAITTSSENGVVYDWYEGEDLYTYDSYLIYNQFLQWADVHLWDKIDIDISGYCYQFYHDKTLSRLALFEQQYPQYSTVVTINGKNYVNPRSMVSALNWEFLSNGIATRHWHGDLQFANIVCNTTDNDYKLIDWREDFAGSVIGDVYYDLAKLYCGALINWNAAKLECGFSVDIEGYDEPVVNIDNDVSYALQIFTSEFDRWLNARNYNLDKIHALCGIICLNMSPLHAGDFGKFLYFRGIQMLGDLCD
jgi:choline kinase/mannose-6-phosphate isomerase-like protein (cupin superfamily)